MKKQTSRGQGTVIVRHAVQADPTGPFTARTA
jgi:hypothetical protein